MSTSMNTKEPKQELKNRTVQQNKILFYGLKPMLRETGLLKDCFFSEELILLRDRIILMFENIGLKRDIINEDLNLLLFWNEIQNIIVDTKYNQPVTDIQLYGLDKVNLEKENPCISVLIFNTTRETNFSSTTLRLYNAIIGELYKFLSSRSFYQGREHNYVFMRLMPLVVFVEYLIDISNHIVVEDYLDQCDESSSEVLPENNVVEGQASSEVLPENHPVEGQASSEVLSKNNAVEGQASSEVLPENNAVEGHTSSEVSSSLCDIKDLTTGSPVCVSINRLTVTNEEVSSQSDRTYATVLSDSLCLETDKCEKGKPNAKSILKELNGLFFSKKYENLSTFNSIPEDFIANIRYLSLQSEEKIRELLLEFCDSTYKETHSIYVALFLYCVIINSPLWSIYKITSHVSPPQFKAPVDKNQMRTFGFFTTLFHRFIKTMNLFLSQELNGSSLLPNGYANFNKNELEDWINIFHMNPLDHSDIFPHPTYYVFSTDKEQWEFCNRGKEYIGKTGDVPKNRTGIIQLAKKVFYPNKIEDPLLGGIGYALFHLSNGEIPDNRIIKNVINHSNPMVFLCIKMSEIMKPFFQEFHRQQNQIHSRNLEQFVTSCESSSNHHENGAENRKYEIPEDLKFPEDFVINVRNGFGLFEKC